ncbi:hypothetical protein HY497_01125 [Candidatus Woesearchaeota archaeon]|nr:hypothetical protein [Candidatus Woesearchaeota archaeon]
MVFKVFHSKSFDDKLEKCHKEFKDRVEKIEDQLMNNPYAGDPLGVRWFREKKHGKFRIYFLIYEDLTSVFMVNISEKKDQQRVINTVKLLFDLYRAELENLLKN